MAFGCDLMADPVVASDGITYDRESIELWMKTHDVSPLTNQPFAHKFLSPNMTVRKLIATWCEQNGLPVPPAPQPPTDKAAAGGGAAAAPLLQKPRIMCAVHAEEAVRVFCEECCRGVCVLCAVDSDACKLHNTKAFKPLFEELKTEREGWARAQRGCNESAELLCASIQADGDAKKHAIDAQVSGLQQQVRIAAAARSSAIGAIMQRQRELEENVAGAAACPEVAVKGSAVAAVVAAALRRAKLPVPPASAAEFRAAAAPVAAVGVITVAAAVVNYEVPVGVTLAVAATYPEPAAQAHAAAAKPTPHLDWATLKKDGFSAKELKNAGGSLAELMAIQYDLPSLKAAGYDAAAFRAAGCDWVAIRTAGFNAAEATVAGCDFATAKSAGYDLTPLVAQRRSQGCGLVDIRAAGFDLPSLKAAGFNAAAFRAAGYDWADMKTAGFVARELRLQGCSLAALVALEFDAHSLFKAGFDYDDMVASGCDVCASGVVLVSCAKKKSLVLSLTLPPPTSSSQRDGLNVYMTLHLRIVDDRAERSDGLEPTPLPAGWQIADGNADDVRVCAAHSWQSLYLIFADGFFYGTAGVEGQTKATIGACARS